MKKILPVTVFVLCMLGSLSCQGTRETVDLKVGDSVLKVELAVTPDEKTTGLMNRDSLPDNYGMLFVYSQDQHMSFWMKNTRIPLSIAFISRDGTIREIRNMEPYSLKSIESQNAVRYALEVPLGLFDRLNIRPGDTAEIPPSVEKRSRERR